MRKRKTSGRDKDDIIVADIIVAATTVAAIVVLCGVIVVCGIMIGRDSKHTEYTENEFNDVTFNVICKCDDGDYIAVRVDTGEVYKGGITAYRRIGEMME